MVQVQSAMHICIRNSSGGMGHLDKVRADRPVDVQKVNIVKAQSVQRTAKSRLNLLVLEMVEIDLCGDEEL